MSSFGLEAAILGPKDGGLTHAELANGRKPISAGFCYPDSKGNIAAYGESVSLKVKSRPEDSELLTRLLKGF